MAKLSYIPWHLILAMKMDITSVISFLSVILYNSLFPSEAIHQKNLLYYNISVIAPAITKLLYSKVLKPTQ